MLVRGSYSRGFRAPSLGELHGSKSRFDAPVVDPCSDFTTTTDAVRKRCIALGVPSDGSYEQPNGQISVITNGNLGLKPETSDSFNISLAYSPAQMQNQPWSDSFDLELAYWDVRITDPITALDAQRQLDRCVIAGDDKYCDGILRNQSGAIFSWTNALLNLGAIKSRGFDLTLAYRMPRRPWGRLRAISQSSYLLAYEQEVLGGAGLETISLQGTLAGSPDRAFPRFKSQLGLGWQYGQVDVSLITRYIHSVTEGCRGLADFPGTCSDPNKTDDNLSTNKLGITVYNDVQVLWTPEFDRRLTVTAGVNNILNRDPPTCFSCSLNGFNGATYDVPGIFGYLSAAYHM
jgi:iron complex outermembrane receptor protein